MVPSWLWVVGLAAIVVGDTESSLPPPHLCNLHALCVGVVRAHATAVEACAQDMGCVQPEPFRCDPLQHPFMTPLRCNRDDCVNVVPFATSRRSCNQWFPGRWDEDAMAAAAAAAGRRWAALRADNVTAMKQAGVHPAAVAARQAWAAARNKTLHA